MEQWTAEQAREALGKSRPDEWTVLDVRQPWEHQEHRLPGARLIPLVELPDRVSEIDPDKPLLVYCHSGGRSQAAARFLEGQGHLAVHNLLGGISAWRGLTASGPINAGLDLFADAADDTDVLFLGYGMEAFLQAFYTRMEEGCEPGEVREAYARLADFEDAHQRALLERHNRKAERPMSREDFDAVSKKLVAEGGVDPERFFRENAATLDSAHDVLSTAMMLEAQAYDFYMRASRLESNESLAGLFRDLAVEERAHMRVLAANIDALAGR
jgi:rhodanese-related sulfurtransferase/rubrerythrin